MDIFEGFAIDAIWSVVAGFFQWTGELLLYGITLGNFRRGKRGFVRSFFTFALGLGFWGGVLWLLFLMLTR